MKTGPVLTSRFGADLRVQRTGCEKLGSWFLTSAGVVLAATGAAKFLSGAGTAPILSLPDPIFGIPFRWLFWIVGGIELTIASVCLLTSRSLLSAELTAWLATAFAVYRLGLLFVAYRKPCPCLGTLVQAIRLPPRAADLAVKAAFAYLLIGSYATLLWLWSKRRVSPSGKARGARVETEVPEDL